MTAANPTASHPAKSSENPVSADQAHGPDLDDAQEESGKGEASKKAISLRLAIEDLSLAKELAQELDLGYQVLLNQVIHEGLGDRQKDLEYRKLVERFRTSLTELKAAQDLANSPAVKAAQELLSTPAIKAAQDLLSAPAVKAAQEAVSGPIQKVRDFGTTSANKAAEEFAQSPLAKAIKELTNSSTFIAAQELANSTGAKLQREWEKSPGGRLAGAIREAAESHGQKPNELGDLTKAVQDIQVALKKAGLM
jgi:predicted DNA binding CopG/RHH family protein